MQAAPVRCRIKMLHPNSVLAAAALLLGVWATAASAAPQKPNILIIVADDMGWHDAPWHGGNYAMPQLDALAKQSLRLEAHYVNPMCSPTRAALLSGRYASRFGCTGAQNERVYPFDTITLATALKSAGYATALTGKWHLGSLPEWGPNKFGFDDAYGSLAGGTGPYDHRYKTGPFTFEWHRNGQRIEEQGHVTDLIANEAEQFVRRKHTSPFFLYLPFTAIHIPIKEPQEWLDKNPGIAAPGDRLRAACASHMDAAIGRVLAALDETGQRENTFVLFFSDNGAHDRLGNADPKFPHPEQYPDLQVGNDNAPLRGFKSGLYEGGIRSPTFVSWPGHLQPGVLEAPLHAADWMPTLTKLVGYDPPRDLKWDGMDIWPTLTGTASAGEPRTLYCLGSRNGDQMVRRGPWKLIQFHGKKPKTELYNLADDIGEQHDLAAERPELVADLTRRMKELAARDGECKVHDPAPK
jgi:arylsulfatase A-like enzyme